MSFCISDKTLLEKYENICTKTEKLKSVKLNALPVHDVRYIKTKLRTYNDKVYTNFRGLNEPEGECESFIIISIDSLLVYKNKYYLQINLNCVYKCVNTEMVDYLDNKIFEFDKLVL